MSNWREAADPKRSALIVVDMQIDFCHECGAQAINGFDVAGCRRIVPALQGLIGAAREADITLYFVRTTHDNTTDSPAWAALHDYWVQPVCQTGSWGVEFYGVSPAPQDVTITKHRYSAFVGTELELRLQSTGRDTLFVTGVTTNVCVESTVRDAYMRNFYTILVEDCTAAVTDDAHRATLRTIRGNFGWVATSDEVINAWADQRAALGEGIAG